MARAALLLSCLLLAAMVAGLLDYLHGADHRDPPLLDLGQAAAYSQEYALAFDPTLGGPSHLSRALALNDALRTSLNLTRPQARQAIQVLDLQRQVLEDAASFPRDPQDTLAGLAGAGGGARVGQDVRQAMRNAQEGLLAADALTTDAAGYAQDGIGFAPGILAIADQWRARLDQWQAVAAQVSEARGGYASFFAGPANGTLDDARRLLGQAGSEREQLYAVPARVRPGAGFAPADVVGLAVTDAQRSGLDPRVVVGLDARGDVAYCAEVQGERLCPVALAREVLNVTGPARLGIVSAAAFDADVPDEGGIVGIFNPAARLTGHLDLEVRAVDGSWNGTASLGPVPADGARIAVFPRLGDGPALLTVRQGAEVLLAWVGESAAGLGLLMG